MMNPAPIPSGLIGSERDRVPPGPSEPRRPNRPIEEPPTPVNQPDGVGDPDEIDERGDVINPPVLDPPREPNEPARDPSD